MGFTLGKLSAKKVESISTPGRYGDGGGLWLQVSKGNTKAWLFRYTHGRKARQMGLGPVHTVTLAEARERARDARKLLLEGIDPLAVKSARKSAAMLAVAQTITFRACAEQYIKDHENTWRHPKHRQQWPNSLATYVYPVIGDLAVQDVEKGLVLQCIEPFWKTKPETCSRVRMRIETVLSWATARGYRSGDNPARWKGHLDQLLPARRKVQRVKHHAALPYRELPEFMARLRQLSGIGARALEFTILTTCRTSEGLKATWREFDLDRGVWVIPPERMKAGREHRVALSKQAIELLRAALIESEFVFPGATKGRELGNMAMLKVLERMGRSDLTVHGFRSTFRDWAAEMTNYPHDVAEMALAHVVGDKTEAAYRRGDMFEKRRRLAEDWARYCISPANSGDVVPIRTAAHA